MKEILIGLAGKPFGIVIYQLLDATQFTIYLSLIAFVGGGAVAVAVTVARVMPFRPAKWFATGYIWIFQSVPLLMLLFLLGLGAPRLIGVDVDPWWAAGSALTLFTSAYLAEVWRGAIQSVALGQWEGSQALGLKFVQTLRLVILPQAVRVALAPTVGFMVQIIKGTSLAYIIGFTDLMSIGKRWANAPVDGTEPYVIYPLMALIYFALCFPLSRLAIHLEHKASKPARQKDSTDDYNTTMRLTNVQTS